MKIASNVSRITLSHAALLSRILGQSYEEGLGAVRNWFEWLQPKKFKEMVTSARTWEQKRIDIQVFDIRRLYDCCLQLCQSSVGASNLSVARQGALLHLDKRCHLSLVVLSLKKLRFVTLSDVCCVSSFFHFRPSPWLMRIGKRILPNRKQERPHPPKVRKLIYGRPYFFIQTLLWCFNGGRGGQGVGGIVDEIGRRTVELWDSHHCPGYF